MNTIIRKCTVVMTVSIALGLPFFSVTALGNSEEKKIKVVDTTPPVITDVKLFDVTATGFQISWKTDEQTKGEIVWDVVDKVSKNSKLLITEDFNTSHHFTITDLSPSTLYYYWVASVDDKGNWATNKPSTFKTLAK